MIKKYKFILITLITVIFAGILGWIYISTQNQSSPEKDSFAQCLKDKNVVMYGAYWCPHCQKQKKFFGDSFQYVNYVECTVETQKCEEKQIKGYPTWIFEDGSRVDGEMTFKQLAEKTSCVAPN